MIRVSEHHFGENDDADSEDEQGLTVLIPEVLEKDYGMFVWPCSIALAEYIWQERHRFYGSGVVELGAGTALPGVVAAKVGGNVTLTDSKQHPQVLENMRKCCVMNNADCKIEGLTWGEWDEKTCSMPQPQIILGADVLYESKDFDDLFATVSFLLSDNPESIFITTYEYRSGHRSIEYLLAKWKLKSTKIVDVLEYLPESKHQYIHSSILLAEIKRAEPGMQDEKCQVPLH